VQSIGGGNVTVHMGLPLVLADRPVVTAAHGLARAATAAVTVPNPHVVVTLDSVAELDGLDLSRPPLVEPPLPDGQNVEFVAIEGPRRLRMRVHERGVGETRSCGTGICAAVAALASSTGVGADGQPWLVAVPGGECEVTWRPDGEILLTGPAVIVAAIELDESWLAAVRE
jgi:diaminopimelate epimerase